MFSKVLIAEDHELVSFSLQATLKELGVDAVNYVHYCDHALTWVNNAIRDGQPFDLLITDIEFVDDDKEQQLKDGLALVKAVKLLLPDIKVIVFTAKDRTHKIAEMFKGGEIDALVRKGRCDGQYLKEALEAVASNKIYQSPNVKKATQERNSHAFSSFDLAVIQLLNEGVPQKEMSEQLRLRDISPYSLSSIEKRLNTMKTVLGFTKNEQLVAYCKEEEIL